MQNETAEGALTLVAKLENKDTISQDVAPSRSSLTPARHASQSGVNFADQSAEGKGLCTNSNVQEQSGTGYGCDKVQHAEGSKPPPKHHTDSKRETTH